MRVLDWATRDAASWISSGGRGPARPGMRPVRVGSRDLFMFALCLRCLRCLRALFGGGGW